MDSRITEVTPQWSVPASADNAVATATRAGEPGRTHFVSGFLASFSAQVAGKELTLSDGGTVIVRTHVHNSLALMLPKPLRITPGQPVTLSLQASGSAGVVGAVTLFGYTV
mgnify:CR=1 FL=1